MTREEAVKTALRQKGELLNAKTAAREKLIAALSEKNPDYSSCSRDISSLGAKLAVTALSGNDADIKAIKEKLENIYLKRAEIIEKAGIKNIKFDCEKCADTGYINGTLCDCVKSIAGDLMIDDLAQKSPCKSCTFESFNLSFYSDDAARKRMSAILELSKKYAADFDTKKNRNLLFMGNTGLGKTHLSLAIANEVIKKGFNVLYSSAYNLFGEIEKEHFSMHTNETYEKAIDCDLLIIDDLGGEFVSPYIQSVAYNIINTRINCGRPTIINTNLNMAKINEIYTPRVASRLIGEYTAKAFLGQDVRQLKKAKTDE